VRSCVSPAAAAAHSCARDRRARSALGPLGVRMGPHRRFPNAARASGARGLRRNWPPAAPAELKPTSRDAVRSADGARILTRASGTCRCTGNRGGGGEIRPAGDRSHSDGACGHRAARPAGGNAGRARARSARARNSEGPHAGLCLLGRTRRRVGGLRSMRSPSDCSQPAGQKGVSLACHGGRCPSGVRLSLWCRLAGRLQRVPGMGTVPRPDAGVAERRPVHAMPEVTRDRG
jgi:hypothetical protein